MSGRSSFDRLRTSGSSAPLSEAKGLAPYPTYFPNCSAVTPLARAMSRKR
jgi:hypothetical protein